MTKQRKVTLIVLSICVLSFSLIMANQLLSDPSLANWDSDNNKITIDQERDMICALAAYAVVYKGWQDDNERGYNIGSVLLSPDNELVFWGRNCVSALESGTQHGEVRLMVGYLAFLHKMRTQGVDLPANNNNLAGYSVYTTLEPCAQCAGMMTLVNLKRTVYGQTDPTFGKAIERLFLNSIKWNKKGYAPYPREVISDRANLSYCDSLETYYKAYEDTAQNKSITGFLKKAQAKRIFNKATVEFHGYKLIHKENKKLYYNAIKLVKSAPSEFVPLFL